MPICIQYARYCRILLFIAYECERLKLYSLDVLQLVIKSALALSCPSPYCLQHTLWSCLSFFVIMQNFTWLTSEK